MAGSLDRPVSMAVMCSRVSPKHSANESNPDLEPYTPNHGVQTWAGMMMHRSSMSNRVDTNSRGVIWMVGLPSLSRELDFLASA